MITIQRHGNGFRMRFSAPDTDMRPYTVQADDATEICAAISHHYASGGHLAGDNTDTCPLCRLMAQEQRAEAAKAARRRR